MENNLFKDRPKVESPIFLLLIDLLHVKMRCYYHVIASIPVSRVYVGWYTMNFPILKTFQQL